MNAAKEERGHLGDPVIPDWANITLPDTWTDALNFKKPQDLFLFLKRVFTRRSGKVLLAKDTMGESLIPKYALQEFHNLPNGNYSRKIARGYCVGFDKVMLGEVVKSRRRIAETFKGMNSVLDVGCGGGHTAAEIKKNGVDDVWGLDPSPYLLKTSNQLHPSINFVQGIIESLDFPPCRFDGVSACFIFHEIPPKYIEQGLQQIHSVLKPNGLLYICEPSPIQLTLTYSQVFKQYGLKGLYFKWLASSVNEPYVDAWHKFSKNSKNLLVPGFELVSDVDSLPIRQILLRKVSL